MPHSRSIRIFRPALATVLTACAATTAGAEGAAPAPEDATDAEPFTLGPGSLTAPGTGDLDAMIARRTVRVLTTYNKIFYFVTGEKRRGVTYEAFHLFEEKLNRSLRESGALKPGDLPVQVVFIPTPRSGLIPALLAGRGDIVAANLTETDERRRTVDFSNPVDTDVSEVVLSAPGVEPPASVEGLSGKTVFVRATASYHESLRALNTRLAASSAAPVDIRLAPDALEDEDLVEMVNAGLIAFTVVDKRKADFWKQVYPEVRVNDTLVLRSGAHTAWAVRPGSPRLLAALNDFLREAGPHTLTRNVLLHRYLGDATRLLRATSDSEVGKFRTLAPLFQKYGERYGIDWLLLAAQGYQESRLDQSVRSAHGAVGVMQLKPATAADMGVGDIGEADANIHAGVKYLRHIMDRHFAAEPMTPENKVLFTLAAYNAGPARVRRLRERAAELGLDPCVWFGHVEYVAGAESRQTVAYVRNIYKYSVGYRLLLEADAAREAARARLRRETT